MLEKPGLGAASLLQDLPQPVDADHAQKALVEHVRCAVGRGVERDEAIIELVHDAPAPPLLGLPLLPREFRPDEADRPAVVDGLARQNVQIDAVRFGIPEHRPDIVYLPVGRRDLVAVEDVQPLKPSLRDGLEIERLGKLLPVDEYDGERSAVET